MSDWLTPIYDRTQADVDFALSEIAKWKESGYMSMTKLKGCLNASDITRIEGNIQYLSDNLSTLYYFPHTESKTWNVRGLPDITDVSRIIGNIEKIISAYYQNSSAPDLPETMLRFEHINSIEENLYLLKEMLDNMIGLFRECGTFNCGED